MMLRSIPSKGRIRGLIDKLLILTTISAYILEVFLAELTHPMVLVAWFTRMMNTNVSMKGNGLRVGGTDVASYSMPTAIHTKEVSISMSDTGTGHTSGLRGVSMLENFSRTNDMGRAVCTFLMVPSMLETLSMGLERDVGAVTLLRADIMRANGRITSFVAKEVCCGTF
jgi:hypothetical protein